MIPFSGSQRKAPLRDKCFSDVTDTRFLRISCLNVILHKIFGGTATPSPNIPPHGSGNEIVFCRPDKEWLRSTSPLLESPMNRTIFKSKIHRATVTHADLHYVGSVTVDLDLLDAADILPGELVAIVDVTNGARLETYTIAGQRGSGVIGINGPAAHLVQENDVVILITYAQMTTEEARAYEPKVVHVDESNKVIQLGNDPAEGLTPGLLRPPYALNNATL